MLKYLYSQVYTREIPNELSLGISIIGCPIHCPECHSPHIWDTGDAVGKDLTFTELGNLIEANKWVSNVLLFGGEWEPYELANTLCYIKESKVGVYKTSLYTGRNLSFMSKFPQILYHLSYLKVGEYNPLLGPIDYPSTNQRLYTMKDGKPTKDITSLFWRVNVR